MITGDQPTCFPPDLLVAVSSRQDGTMLDRSLPDRHDVAVVANRRRFVSEVGEEYDSCVYQIITYGDEQRYDSIAEVDRADTEGVCADALYTETPGLGLFLPVADCVATVVYDPTRRALALAHLGRHASIAKLMAKLIDFMVEKNSEPDDLIVWMAPSVAQVDYRMEYFDHVDDPDWQPYVRHESTGFYLDLAGFNAALARGSGVRAENIHISSANTAQDPHYFSHSQGDTSGRFAVFAALRAV